MKSKIKTLGLVVWAALAAPATVPAAVPADAVQGMPGLIGYQGSLVDPETGDKYADGIYTLDVRLWTSEDGESDCIWGAQYSAFVKGGAFTLMLGDPNAKDLTAAEGVLPTYKRTELWKAMWGASATDAVRYLGVTPHQNAKGAALDTLAEIAPRQLLASAPFVFRAGHAQYADRSPEGFTVAGDLAVEKPTTLTGVIDATSSGSLRFGPISATATEIKLAGVTAPSQTAASIWTVGSVVNLLAYGQLFVQPSSGDVIFDIKSGYRLNMTGSGSFVSETPVHTIGGTGETKITGGSVKLQATGGSISLEEDANCIRVRNGTRTSVAAKSVSVDASSAAQLYGNPAQMTSTGTAQLKADGSWVSGKGTFRWKRNGVEYAPFVYRSLTINVDQRHTSGSASILSDSNMASQYNWMVAGFDGFYSNYSGDGRVPAQVSCSGNTVTVYKHDAAGLPWTCIVDVVGILKGISR